MNWRHCLGAILLLLGCDNAKLAQLQAGVSDTQAVRAQFGEPNAQWPNPDGGMTWEDPRGPNGQVTYFLIFDPQQRYQRAEQVLTEENFSRIQAGMSRDDVRHRLGKPGKINTFERLHEEVWDWRYLGIANANMHFHVHFDIRTGQVTHTSQAQELTH